MRWHYQQYLLGSVGLVLLALLVLDVVLGAGLSLFSPALDYALATGVLVLWFVCRLLDRLDRDPGDIRRHRAGHLPKP